MHPWWVQSLKIITTSFSSGEAKRNHHNMAGGLLYHICRMHEMATYVSSLYDCDADLLMAGVDLHDIGKLHELLPMISDLQISQMRAI